MSILNSALFSKKRPSRQQATALLSFVVATAVGFVPGPRLDDGTLPAAESSVTQATAAASATAPAASAQPAAPSTLNQPSATQPSGGGTTLLGNDVSWPQCDKALPGDPAFAVVGVNNGLANTTNPCLHQQLDWADDITPDLTGQPSVALYVNTANPGSAGSWWPTSNDYGGKTVPNPYGECKGQADVPCAYMYGYAKAFDDAYLRSITDPEDFLWWLDVETGNSWSGNKDANRADLEGMTDFFHSIGADVGIYSNGFQWGQIVGQVSPGSSLYNLPSWLAGARTATAAKGNCSAAPLTAGGQVVLAQFVSNGFDYDHSCI